MMRHTPGTDHECGVVGLSDDWIPAPPPCQQELGGFLVCSSFSLQNNINPRSSGWYFLVAYCMRMTLSDRAYIVEVFGIGWIRIQNQAFFPVYPPNLSKKFRRCVHR